MWGVLHGDFGESYRFRGRPVSELLFPKMWVSFQVNLAALIVSLSIGLPLGFFIAHRQGTWQDPAVVTIALVLMSIPIMISIPLTLWGLCLKLQLVPCSGWGGFFDLRIITPAITLGIPGVAGLARFMRASTLDVLGQDFIRTAKAKGLSSVTVDVRHVLKNAMIPIVTLMAFVLAGMFVTSFIVEFILGIPGVGHFTIDSIFNPRRANHNDDGNHWFVRVCAGKPAGRYSIRIHRPTDTVSINRFNDMSVSRFPRQIGRGRGYSFGFPLLDS
ncbi:Dipeptide transport system permease protein DppB [Geodia barretti]|nr:Dipeptide transport system permease protein DppB [Geodia barretti]